MDVVAPGNHVVTSMVPDEEWVGWINAGGKRFFGTPMNTRQVSAAAGRLVDAGRGRPGDLVRRNRGSSPLSEGRMRSRSSSKGEMPSPPERALWSS